MNIDRILLITSAIIKNTHNQILLIQRSETKTFKEHWQLPEGKIKPNESPDQSLKREIKEEINQHVKDIKLKFVTYTQLEAKQIQYLAVRLVYSVDIELTAIQLSDEHSNFQWTSPKNAFTLQLLPGTQEILEMINKSN